MHPYQHAAAHPDRLALALADSGETLTYRQLDEGSNRFAQLLRAQGLKPGDRIAILLKNCLEFPIAYWGAQRAGLLSAMLSTHLKPEEAAYIINDCGAQLLVTSAEIGETVIGESHAWVEWFCGSWHGYDPTNSIDIGDRHVRVGHGRDYTDVTPLRGVYAGMGGSELFVSVEITREA